MIFSSALGFSGVVFPLHRQAVCGKSICSGPRRQVVAGDGSSPTRLGSHISRRGSPTQIYSPLYVSRFLTGGCYTESRDDDEVGTAKVSSNRQSKSNAGREVVRALNSNGAKSAAFVSRDGDADLEPLLPSVEASAEQDKDNEKENENQFRTMEEIVAAVGEKQSKMTEEEAVSRVDPSLPTMRDIVARAGQEGINLEVKSFGPSFQIIVTSPDETVVFGKADGWIKWWWRKGKILHLESVILDRGVSKKVGNVFGAGFFVGAATLRYGLDQGCRTAELLAIYDDESTHSKLVKYYSRIGFETLYEVNEEEMKYFPDRVVWGGVGTRMDADCEELLRKWCPVLKPKAKSRSRSKGGFSRRAPVVTRE